MRFVAVDLGLSKKWDLRIEANVKDLEARILRGEFDQVHSGVPMLHLEPIKACSRWATPPLRSREIPWGCQSSPVDYGDSSRSTTC